MKKIALLSTADAADPLGRLGVNIALLALEAYASDRSRDVKVIICEDINDLLDASPDIAGISCISECYGMAIGFAKKIKKKLGIPVIVGGVHITACPKSLHKVFSAGVMGEGEETLLDIVRSYPKLDDVQGIVHWKKDQIKINPQRPQISDLNKLPPLNRKRWIDKIGLAYVMTSRGCPYRCGFCSSPVHWRNSCRLVSPENVVREICDIADDFDIKFVRFMDDIFTISKPRLKKIVALMKEKGLQKRLAFGCFSRANLIDEEVLNLLNEGNIKYVSIGVESASERILPQIKDASLSITEIQKVIDMSFSAGIRLGTTYMIGMPEESEEDLVKTLKFIEKNRGKMFEVEINPVVPLPGTLLWEDAMKKGLVSYDMDWPKLKDHAFLPTFDPDSYIYLNEKIPYKKFVTYVKRFTELFKEISMSKRTVGEMSKYFKPGDVPATFKRSGRAS